MQSMVYGNLKDHACMVASRNILTDDKKLPIFSTIHILLAMTSLCIATESSLLAKLYMYGTKVHILPNNQWQK